MRNLLDKTPEKIIVYDGDCALCNFAVRYVLFFDKNQKDKENQFYFTSLYFPLGEEILKKSGNEKVDTVVYKRGEDFITKSKAILLILKDLGGVNKILYFILNIFPDRFLDFMYIFVSKVRYKIFGKSKNRVCDMMDEETEKRILYKKWE